jgi:CBS domain-containing protein
VNVQTQSRGKRVQVFFGETDQVGHGPLSQALLAYLRKEGAAGGTITRGVAGFGASSKLHTAAILTLSLDLPMVLTWIDAPGRVDRLLPGLLELSGSGIVTVEDVSVVAYGGRRLEQLRFDLPVQDVMTRPALSVGVDEPARRAAELIVGQPFRALPVVDSDRRVVGMVSSGDLVDRAGLGARLELLNAMPEADRDGFLSKMLDRTVGNVMTRDVATVKVSDSVATATHLMAERRIKRVPVVDGDGRLAGVLSRSDVLRAVGETFPRDVEPIAEHPGARVVREIMRADVPSVPADAGLPQLLDAVISTRLNRAVVLDKNDQVVGVVSDADVLASVDPAARGDVVSALMRTAGHPPGGSVKAVDVVTREALTVGPETPIAEAAAQMTSSRVKVLCVVDADRKLLGIVDRADLLQAAGTALSTLAAATPPTASPATDSNET